MAEVLGHIFFKARKFGVSKKEGGKKYEFF